MPAQWSADDDRALLLSLVQVMAPNGPSKHQFEGARAILDNRWTLSAITYETSPPKVLATCKLLTISSSQHYNKKLRTLSPATEGAGADPATPARGATKRKAPASKAADPTASPTPGTESGRGKKKAAAVKAVSDEAAKRNEDDEQSPTKKAKVDASGGSSEDQERDVSL